jgi:CPA1 family monovalent cation:H+ antiporter
VGERPAEGHRHLLEDRLDRLRSLLDEETVEVEGFSDDRLLRTELSKVQRKKLQDLYRKGRIHADTLRAVQRRLDLDDPSTRRGF